MPGTRPMPLGPQRGLFPLVIAAGIVLGVAANFWIPKLEILISSRWTINWGRSSLWWFYTIGLVLPILLVAPVLAYFIGSTRRVAIAAATFIFALVVARDVTEGMVSVDGGLYCRGYWITDLVRRLSRTVPIAAMVGVASVWIVNSVFGRPIAATGRFCWKCSYDLGSEAVTTCPECGAEFDATRAFSSVMARRWAALTRRGGVVLACVGVIALLAMTYRVVTYTWPVERFLRAIDPSGTRALFLPLFSGFTGKPLGPGPSVVLIPMAAWQPIQGADGLCVTYGYLPRPPIGLPAMRVQLTFVPAQRYTSALKYWGTPDTGGIPIFADLTAEQAEQVIRAGRAPEGLIQLLVSTSKQRGFSPAGEGVMGGARTSSLDATPYFMSAPSPSNTP